MEQDLTIILPAYNEEVGIDRVLQEIQDLKLKCRLLVGDNNSTDRTREVCRARGVEPVSVMERGKGNVIRALLKAVDTPYVIMLDSDFTYPLAYAHPIYALLKLEQNDVVLGIRALREKGAMGRLHAAGNWGLSYLASMLYGYRVYDLCTGMWGFRKDALQQMRLKSTGFTLEADFFTSAMKAKLRVGQVPIAYRGRVDGSKSKLRMDDGFKIGWFLVGRRFSKD